jgi:hypothetical protein
MGKVIYGIVNSNLELTLKSGIKNSTSNCNILAQRK